MALLKCLAVWKESLLQSKSLASIFIWNPAVQSNAQNPYQGMLYAADLIAVTADSVGMCSEACSTGKPVITMMTGRCRRKFRSFHQNLVQYSYATRIEDCAIDGSWKGPGQALNETSKVADLLLPRILEHHETSWAGRA